MLEQLPVGVLIAEVPSGRIVVANEQASALLGDGSGCPFAAALARGEVVRDQLAEIEVADGSLRVVSVSAGPIRAADGTVRAGVAVFHDVTERERRERAQRDSSRMPRTSSRRP